MSWYHSGLSMIGGVGLLLYGMSVLKDNLQKVAGKKLREILIIVSKRKTFGMLLGIFITLLFQSSTATMFLLVGLTSAGIIALQEALPVILGANIGSTVTAQLIAFKVTELSLPIIFIGTFVLLFSKTTKGKQIAFIILGFGLLFLGLKIMSDTMGPLKTDPTFSHLLLSISKYPFLCIIIATLFTFLVASSAATIGIIILLAMQNMITLEPAIYMLLGANMGTAFLAVLSSLGSTREAQRVATAHLLFNVTGALLMLPFVKYVAILMSSITKNPGFQVANTNSIFILVMAILCIPFTNQCSRVLNIALPDKEEFKNGIKPRYLDETLLDSPEIALGMATREAMQISDLVAEMLKTTNNLFEAYNQDKADEITEKEDYVDLLCIATNKYLTQLLRQQLSRDEFNNAMGLVNIVREYEFIGDVLSINILTKAESLNKRNLDFSDSGKNEIQTMHDKVLDLMNIVNTSLATNNPKLIEKANKVYDDIVDLEFRLRMSHIARMQKGTRNTEDTSFIHLDVINSYLRISEHLSNIACTLSEEVSCTWYDEAQILTPPSAI